MRKVVPDCRLLVKSWFPTFTSALGAELATLLKTWGTGEGNDRAQWRKLQQNGMRAHFGWDERVTAYEQVYRMVAPGR